MASFVPWLIISLACSVVSAGDPPAQTTTPVEAEAAQGPAAQEPAAAQPEVRPTLIVLDLVAERQMDESLVRLLNELLLTEFARSDKYKVLGSSDVKAMINHEIQRTITGCQEVSCMAEIGGMLGADYLGLANIGRVGDYYLLNVKVLNVVNAAVEERWSTQVEGIENKLMNAVRASVAAVTGQPPPPGVEMEGDTTMETLPVILGGVGGLFLANGVVFGLITKSYHDRVEDPDAMGRQAAAEDGPKTQVVANVSYGLGVASLIAAGVIWFLADDPPRSMIVVQPTQDRPGLVAVGTVQF